MADLARVCDGGPFPPSFPAATRFHSASTSRDSFTGPRGGGVPSDLTCAPTVRRAPPALGPPRAPTARESAGAALAAADSGSAGASSDTNQGRIRAARRRVRPTNSRHSFSWTDVSSRDDVRKTSGATPYGTSRAVSGGERGRRGQVRKEETGVDSRWGGERRKRAEELN